MYKYFYNFFFLITKFLFISYNKNHHVLNLKKISQSGIHNFYYHRIIIDEAQTLTKLQTKK